MYFIVLFLYLFLQAFLQHLTPLLSLSTFMALWLTILDFMDKYMHADKSDLLVSNIVTHSIESSRYTQGNHPPIWFFNPNVKANLEFYKNMLLVTYMAGVFQMHHGYRDDRLHVVAMCINHWVNVFYFSSVKLFQNPSRICCLWWTRPVCSRTKKALVNLLSCGWSPGNALTASCQDYGMKCSSLGNQVNIR